MCEEFLDRHSQGAVESRKVFQEVSFFTEPETIDHRNTVRSVESGKGFGNLWVCIDWEIAADIGEDERFVVDSRDLVCWELKHLMDYFPGLLRNIFGRDSSIGTRGGFGLAIATSGGSIGG
jgi:hypothetical protein